VFINNVDRVENWNTARPYRTVPARKNEFFHSGGRSGGEKWNIGILFFILFHLFTLIGIPLQKGKSGCHQKPSTIM